jgi:hypothetical protein
MSIGIKKGFSLKPSLIVQTAIDPTALHDVLQIKIRLAVPYYVYFFAGQFSVILGAKIGKYYSVTGIS